jgi:hypothetical protein
MFKEMIVNQDKTLLLKANKSAIYEQELQIKAATKTMEQFVNNLDV